MLPAEPSPLLTWLCVAISAAIIAGVPLARRLAGRRAGESDAQTQRATLITTIVILGWAGVSGGLAAAGALSDFSGFPPPVLPVIFTGLLLTVAAALSPFGRRLALDLPLALLVGYQAFRIAVEIMLHRAGSEGVIGMHMTWSGLNFDVLTGLTGLALGVWLWRRGPDAPAPRGLLWAWNIMGLGLLVTIVSVAIMSVPGPLRRFDGPPNVWIGHWPFVWLPTLMVAAALFGHVLLFRRLLAPTTKPGS